MIPKTTPWARQKGLLPILTKLLGTLSLAFYFFGVAAAIYAMMIEPAIWHEENVAQIVVTLILALLIPAPFGFPGPILVSMYPDIRLTPQGIQYRYLRLFGGTIHWEEVDNLTKTRRFARYDALIIDRPGFNLFTTKGLWLNTYHGLIFGIFIEPVLLLSDGLENRQHILREIRSRSTHLPESPDIPGHYVYQLGVLPAITRMLGIIATAICFLGMVFTIVIGMSSPLKTTLALAGLLLIGYTGLILSSMYPDIRLTTHGIKHQFMTFRGIIRWQEITGITQTTRLARHTALTLSRPKGLHLQAIHGLIFGIPRPILLLSDKMQHYETIMREIHNRAPVPLG